MNKNNTHINDDLLVKYLLHEANADEKLQVEEWIDSDRNNLHYFDDFKLLIEKSQIDADNSLNEYDALDRLRSRMKREYMAKSKRSINFRTFIRVAASVIIIMGTILWLTYLATENGKQVDIQTTENILKQTLPDGSIVILNKNTTISYPGKFSDTIRSVRLKGEAFFRVKSNKKQPFVIIVNDVMVKVVGTSFNIKSRNKQTVVDVETGIVEVSKKDKNIVLKAGEKTRIQAKTNALYKETIRGRLYDYYYSNELVCDRTPLWELVEVLNDKFNVSIIISRSSIRHMPITTVFKDESLEQILQVIATTFDIKVERKGGQILLK